MGLASAGSIVLFVYNIDTLYSIASCCIVLNPMSLNKSVQVPVHCVTSKSVR